MTIAICLRCGEYKHGAFNKCSACHYEPSTLKHKAMSMLLSDHNCNEVQLAAHSNNIKIGSTAYIDQEELQAMMSVLGSPQGEALSGMLDHILKTPATQHVKSPDWTETTAQIAKLIIAHEDAFNGSIRILANPAMASGMSQEFQRMGLRKPFFRFAPQHVYDCVLTHESAMLNVLPSSMLVAASNSDKARVFYHWTGYGKYCFCSESLWGPGDFFKRGREKISLIMYITPMFEKMGVSGLLEHPTLSPFYTRPYFE
jgi:hypothetical protein